MSSTSEDSKDVRYWKIAPGEDAWNWDACREGGFIAIGWEDLGNLSEMTREQFEARRDDLVAKRKDWTKVGVDQAWRFAQIQEGDRVVANHGLSDVLGIGRVTGPYYFAEGERHSHRYPVTWEDTTPRKLEDVEYGWRRTLVELDREKFETIRDTTSAAVGYFTPKTFELLEGLHRDPTTDYYMPLRDAFETDVIGPFKQLFHDVADSVPATILDLMETERGLFSRIPKNDYGRGGAWDAYWGAFYPKGSKRTDDVQLLLWVCHYGLAFGFFIADNAAERREHFLERCRDNYEELETVLRDVLSRKDLVFDPHDDVVVRPDGTVECKLGLTWQGWLQQPDQGDFAVSVYLPRDEVLAQSKEESVGRIARTYERLFPLILLSTEDDPLPAMTEAVSDWEKRSEVQTGRFEGGGRTSAYFNERTFELLEELHRNPTKDYYMGHRDDFETYLMEPFKRLFSDVAEDLPSTITDRMETERWLFSRIPKNDYGQGGAWDYYWGAFYPKESKRLEDAQLSLWINYERLEIGFYIGEYGTKQRQRFLRRCREHYDELQTILQDVLSGDDIVFAPHKGIVIKPDGSVEVKLDLTWQEWLENPDRADFDVSVVLPRDETLATSEDELRNRVARVYEQLFPLVLLTIEDDPLPSIAEYLDSAGDLHRSEAQSQQNPPAGDLQNALQRALSGRGLQYSDWQVATFYTALQTKGFVILSGISGTGKTKLAQAFAEMLPQPTVPQAEARDDVISITVQPYMPKYNRLIIPKHFTKLYEPPPRGESKDVELTFASQSQTCRLQYADYVNTNYIVLYLRGDASPWFGKTFDVGDTVVLEPRSDEDGRLLGFHMGKPSDPAFRAGNLGRQPSNDLFVPVRTDWRDSKSLLGYYNPLTQTYEWTDFLRFLLRAVQSYRQDDGLAWFVILDEMNLARVEYYFADLLSVLESGRDAEGWTRESLRLPYPDDAEGDLPPSQVKVPPNLYVIGTVNVDETTHTFSPKVLDRAFTLELTEADFSGYPPDPSKAPDGEVDAAEREAVLANFTHEGQFVRIDKASIAAYVENNGDVREHLQRLNDQLRPYQLHFGYRVFDEIVAFLISAEENDLYSNVDEAFGAAVLMKVLPKFHGSRGKLEEPLKHVLAWCLSPDTPDYKTIDQVLKGQEDSDAAIRALGEQSYRYSRTAAKARRMLWELYTSGFASFS